ncbi:BBA14 family lipoprotein (plasmid) [Borrelia recurrentis]|uniref:Lipoprotein n=1 Tax=Borrelia recurrentis (strain A1) TaxID=412418 RepID=B5RS04_BORRA|nr:BBA14 family lipoprotein [Borrelia recurrentis]ACH95140.1 putative lipoprotein [Borrelia recurrentis A1]
MNKKSIVNLIILLQFITFSCKSIASLTNEPEPPIEPTLKNLSIYETQLTSYVLYFETFLIRAKQKFPNYNFPPFTLFDPKNLKEEHTLQTIKENIKHLKHYINTTKPIAIDVYKKCSKLKK